MNLKALFLTLCILGSTVSVYAQIDLEEYFEKRETKTMYGMELHRYADSPAHPEYNLGLYINRIMRYPLEAMVEGVADTIFVRFIVDKKGVIWHAKAIDTPGRNKYLVAEAERIIGKMPPWKPAMLDGEKVNGMHLIKVKFFLREESKKKIMRRARKELMRREEHMETNNY